MLIEDGLIIRGEERWRIQIDRLGEIREPSTSSGMLQSRPDGLVGMAELQSKAGQYERAAELLGVVLAHPACLDETMRYADPVLTALREVFAASTLGAALTFRSCAGQKRPGCPLTGYEQLYFRTWVRLAEDHQYVHHFLSIAGTQPGGYWDCDGNAGCRPNGQRAAGTTVDFNRGHELFFYTYFPEMKCDRGGYCSGDYARGICEQCAQKDMPCPSEPECCWGNHFGPVAPVVLPRGEWACLERGMRSEHAAPVGRLDGLLAQRRAGPRRDDHALARRARVAAEQGLASALHRCR